MLLQFYWKPPSTNTPDFNRAKPAIAAAAGAVDFALGKYCRSVQATGIRLPWVARIAFTD